MKRSTMLLVGAAGVTLAAWGAERSMNRPGADRSARAALPAECVLGADGKMPALPQCQTTPAQRSSSSSSSSYRSSSFGGGWGGSSSDHTTSTTSSGSHGPSVSRGGFGSSSSSFTSSGS